MIELRGQPLSYCDGVRRRDFLKVGYLGLGGLTLSHLLRHRAEAGDEGRSTPGTSVIFIEMAGGPPQHETYDPKPLAPSEFRGMYGVTRTNVPGVILSDRMPHQAKVMDKLAIIRSIHHDSSSHRTSSHLTQTGYYLRDRQNNENEMPCVGSIAAKVRGPSEPGVPPFVSIPRVMRFGDAGWLGKGYNAFATGGDPNDDDFQVRNLTLPPRAERDSGFGASSAATVVGRFETHHGHAWRGRIVRRICAAGVSNRDGRSRPQSV